MRTPTTSQLRTAIEVMKNLGERINENAAHSVIQLPESRFGDQHAARIEARRDRANDPNRNRHGATGKLARRVEAGKEAMCYAACLT